MELIEQLPVFNFKPPVNHQVKTEAAMKKSPHLYFFCCYRLDSKEHEPEKVEMQSNKTLSHLEMDGDRFPMIYR